MPPLRRRLAGASFLPWRSLLVAAALALQLPPVAVATTPLINMSPERKAVLEAHVSTRAAAKFKIVAAAVLSGGSKSGGSVKAKGAVKQHASWYAATEEEAAAVLNALVFGGNLEADAAALASVGGHSKHQHYGGGSKRGGEGLGFFRSPTSEAALVEREHLGPDVAARLNFTAGFVAAYAPEGAESNPDADAAALGAARAAAAARGGAAMRPKPAAPLEEVEYALRQHLLDRGLVLHRLASRQAKLAERGGTPGALEYRRALGDDPAVGFVECASRTGAYSAAWVGTRQLVLDVDMTPRATLEWHSHNMFIHTFYKSRVQKLNTYG